MFFDVKARLAEIQKRNANGANFANPAKGEPDLAKIAGLAAKASQNPAMVSADDPPIERSEMNGLGCPVIRGSQVVSLDEWRAHRERNSYGPTGKRCDALREEWGYD